MVKRKLKSPISGMHCSRTSNPHLIVCVVTALFLGRTWNYRINLRQTFQLEHVMKFCMSEPISHMSDLNCHAEFISKIETFAVICTAKRQVVKRQVNKLAVMKLGTFSVLCVIEIFRLLYFIHFIYLLFSFLSVSHLIRHCSKFILQ